MVRLAQPELLLTPDMRVDAWERRLDDAIARRRVIRAAYSAAQKGRGR